MTVEMTLERFIDHRKNANLPSNFGHIGRPSTSLAVLRDLKLGFHTNALAGLALCLARPGQSAGPDRRVSASLRPTLGVPCGCTARAAVEGPVRLVESRLHHDVRRRPDALRAPLLAPVVLGATPEEFMFHRVLALHLHICLFILRRARAFDEVDGAARPRRRRRRRRRRPFIAPSLTSAASWLGRPPRPWRLPATDIRRRSLALCGANMDAAMRYGGGCARPFVRGARTANSVYAARSVPFPAALILPPPRGPGVRGVVVRTARERAERATARR